MRARLLTAILLLGCGKDDPLTPPPASTYVPPPAVAVVETGIVRDLFLVPGVHPGPNPTLAVETPKERDVVRVVRYRLEKSTPARAIVVMMPGFLGGAGSFDGVARALVRRGLTDPTGVVEVWAIDRRANLLEDTHGSDVAEVKKDPGLARKYYYDGEAVEGKTFAGFYDQSDLGYVSEWGLPVTLGDLRNVIARVPAAERKQRVVLLGHSLGGTIVESYAAWDFEGQRGLDDLAGLVLVDGVSGNELDPASSFSEKDYLEGSTTGTGSPFSAPGLNVIRKVQPYVALPFFGVKGLEHAERLAMAARFSKAAPRIPDDDVTASLALILGLKSSTVPKTTSRGAFGLAFDDASSTITIGAVSCGKAVGGPLASYKSLLGGTLLQPSDPSATYDWEDGELTALADLADAWFSGPGLNFGEWYFPARLSLDASLAGSLVMEPGDFREKYGLRMKHGAAIDLPVLAMAAALTADADGSGTAKSYDKLRAMLGDKPIGEGRALAGVPRTDPRAWQLIVRPKFTHIDPLMARDQGEGKAWYDALASFVKSATKDGGVTVP